jgi:hypothetical protein
MKESSRWDFVAEKKTLRLWLAALPRDEIFSANGIGYTMDQQVPCLIWRRKDQQTRFVAAYDLTGNEGKIQGLRADTDPRRERLVELKTVEGNWRITFGPTGATVEKHTN